VVHRLVRLLSRLLASLVYHPFTRILSSYASTWCTASGFSKPKA